MFICLYEEYYHTTRKLHWYHPAHVWNDYLIRFRRISTDVVSVTRIRILFDDDDDDDDDD